MLLKIHQSLLKAVREVVETEKMMKEKLVGVADPDSLYRTILSQSNDNIRTCFEDMEEIYPDYINSYNEISKLLSVGKLEKKISAARSKEQANQHKEDKKGIKKEDQAPRPFDDLSKNLIGPVQRIPRYPMLLAEILRQYDKMGETLDQEEVLRWHLYNTLALATAKAINEAGRPEVSRSPSPSSERSEAAASPTREGSDSDSEMASPPDESESSEVEDAPSLERPRSPSSRSPARPVVPVRESLEALRVRIRGLRNPESPEGSGTPPKKPKP